MNLMFLLVQRVCVGVVSDPLDQYLPGQRKRVSIGLELAAERMPFAVSFQGGCCCCFPCFSLFFGFSCWVPREKLSDFKGDDLNFSKERFGIVWTFRWGRCFFVCLATKGVRQKFETPWT